MGNKPPQGMSYRGIASQAVALGCSPALAEHLPQFCDLLRAMGAHSRAKTVWADTFEALAEAFASAAASEGLRTTRLQKSMAWLCTDEADIAAEVAKHNLTEPLKQLPQTFDKFFERASPAATIQCPGRWTW